MGRLFWVSAPLLSILPTDRGSHAALLFVPLAASAGAGDELFLSGCSCASARRETDRPSEPDPRFRCRPHGLFAVVCSRGPFAELRRRAYQARLQMRVRHAGPRPFSVCTSHGVSRAKRIVYLCDPLKLFASIYVLRLYWQRSSRGSESGLYNRL